MDASFYRCKQVLVVDDCAPVRSSIKAILQQMGFEAIHLARDANEALEKCLELPFDFILCDFHLGEGRDGHQLFESLKQQQLLSALCCFIIISAENQRQTIHGVIELQPDDYILKPFSFPILSERLTRAVKQKIALRKILINLFEQDEQQAIKACESVVKNKPEFSAAANRLKGELLLKTGQYAAAEHFYQQILDSRNFAWARLGRALAAFYLERWDDTELQLADLTQYDETKVEALDWLSRLYVKYGRYDAAQKTLYEAVLLAPKNITRQKTLSNLNTIIGNKEAAARINQKLIAAARFSMHETPDLYLNHARSLIDVAYSKNLLERTIFLQHATQLLDGLNKRFDVSRLTQAIAITRSRVLAARGQLLEAKELLNAQGQLENSSLTIDGCMDAAKAHFELGDLHASEFYIDKLAGFLAQDDFLTETQRIMLKMEQQRHQQLKAQIKQINSEAAEAYQAQYFGRATSLFCELLDYMPTNPVIALNLLQAASKVSGLTEQTLSYSRKAIQLLLRCELSNTNQDKFNLYYQQLCEQYPELQQRAKRQQGAE
ncbi:response regulator [Arsukibacterium sp.]|uniref:response regulator n=1 Tax=Arsukibacterium sp. TaxID=1977258 RepID=UPI002FDB0414